MNQFLLQSHFLSASVHFHGFLCFSNFHFQLILLSLSLLLPTHFYIRFFQISFKNTFSFSFLSLSFRCHFLLTCMVSINFLSLSLFPSAILTLAFPLPFIFLLHSLFDRLTFAFGLSSIFLSFSLLLLSFFYVDLFFCCIFASISSFIFLLNSFHFGLCSRSQFLQSFFHFYFLFIFFFSISCFLQTFSCIILASTFNRR